VPDILYVLTISSIRYRNHKRRGRHSLFIIHYYLINIIINKIEGVSRITNYPSSRPEAGRHGESHVQSQYLRHHPVCKELFLF